MAKKKLRRDRKSKWQKCGCQAPLWVNMRNEECDILKSSTVI